VSRRVKGLSVVIPTFNGAAWVIGAIRSVLDQDVDIPLQVVVVDDGSTDDTLARVKSIADPRVQCTSTPRNLGVAGARNVGLRLSQYEWVGFNDQDDVWLPGRLGPQLRLLDEHPEFQAVAGGAGRLAADGRSQWSGNVLGFRWTPEHRPRMGAAPAYDPRYDDTTYLQTLICSREVANAVGGFNENLPLSDDLDFFMKLAHSTKMGCVSEPVFLYRLGDHNQTAPNVAKADRFLGAHAYYAAAMRARAAGTPEPDAATFLKEYRAGAAEVDRFRLAQGIRHINTVWVNRGLAHALVAGLGVLARHPMAFTRQFLERTRWWLTR
jgi:glycosyltransferase involved in cell wall biosynthesis